MDRVTEEVIEGDCTPWMDSAVVVKQEPAWSMEEDSPDQPSAVYSTAQPMSDNTSGSLLSLKRGRVCQRCSAAFVLVSSLELHLASVHGEPLPFPEWTESCDRQMTLPHGRLSTEETDHVRKYSADSDTEFVLKLEPAWSMEEDSPDQPSAVYSTVQPMSDNTSGSLLSLKRDCVCQHCSAAFVLVSSLELHRASVHGKKLHMVLPGSSTPDRCDAGNCSYSGIILCNLMKENSQDKKTTTKMKIDDDDTGDKDEKNSRQHVCDVCEESFFDSSNLTKHNLMHSSVQLFVCDVCWKCFSQASDLKTHKLTHENRNDHNAAGHGDGERSGQHVCDVCRKSFPIPSKLKRHKLIHNGAKPFVCDVCGKSYAQAGHLKTHKLTHSGQKAFVCDVCSKRFTLASLLTKHKRIHTGKRPHKCPHCDRAFSQSGSLQLHIKSVHEDARPHLCDVCGAAFSRTVGLTNHRRIHTGEKPYMCSDCGKCFASYCALRRHRLTHTGEKPHMCSDCGKGFARPEHLAEHRLTHTGEKPHSCPHCPAAFRLSHQLKKHVRRKHQ